MSLTTIIDGPRHRRRIYADKDSVLIVREEKRQLKGGELWVVLAVEPVQTAPWPAEKQA